MHLTDDTRPQAVVRTLRSRVAIADRMLLSVPQHDQQCHCGEQDLCWGPGSQSATQEMRVKAADTLAIPR